MAEKTTSEALRIIKKYQNRRLYDTEESIYITLQDVKELVLCGTEFMVQDANSGDDITRQVLLGIILEEEAGGVPLFSNQLLRQIISFYGHTFQTALGRYLEGNIRHFSEAQGQFQEQMRKLMPHHEDPSAAMSKLLSMSSPNMPNFFGSYLESSKKMFELMTESFRANPWTSANPRDKHSSPSFASPAAPRQSSMNHSMSAIVEPKSSAVTKKATPPARRKTKPNPS